MDQQGEMQELSETVKSLQKQVEDLRYELRAWKVRAHHHCPRCGKPSLEPSKPLNKPFNELPLPEAVLMVLAEGAGPIAIRKVRMLLEERGMKSKLGKHGNSLRTAVARLVRSGRIQREGDTVEMLK